MTTDQSPDAPDLTKMNANLAKIELLSQRLITALGNKKQTDPGLQAPGQELFAKAATAYMGQVMSDPAKLMEQQVSFWGKSLKYFADAQEMLASNTHESTAESVQETQNSPNGTLETQPFFRYVEQQYLDNVDAISKAIDEIKDLSPDEMKRLEFFTGQIVNMMNPANFLGTNPAALAKAVETEGQSLVDGLENLVRDVETNSGELVLTLADKSAFKVGENLATTPGSVVFRNRMFELIQYTPTTEKVYKRPLLIFPPWINKFYILDLKEKNSLIKWIVDQGFTLFVVSWVNPDASYADVGMETYIQEGYLAAIDEVKKITGEKSINTVGYCIAGATLGLTLSLLKKRNDKSISSATFFTTLTDFSDQGEVGVFLNDDFVDGIEREVANKGIMHAVFMSRTFSYLRSNDLIYKPAIRSYMMGEAPPAFDLLYWNGDGTNLPGAMAIEYLRGLCQDDLFARGTFPLFGEELSIKEIDVPICAIACETDHIAAWKSSFAGVQKMGAKDKTFILSESGHVAGIVNPPSKKKYGHYTNPDLSLDSQDWQAGAKFNKNSWWPTWGKWLAKRSGKKVLARNPGGNGVTPLCKAPGTYVLVQASS